MCFSIRLLAEEKRIAESYAKMRSMSLEEAFKQALFERIEDEYDVEEMSYREIDEKNFLIDAGMTLEKFNQTFQTTIDSDEVDTMAGIILEELGYFPEDDEVVEVRQENVLLKPTLVENGRIRRIHVHLLTPEEVEAYEQEENEEETEE